MEAARLKPDLRDANDVRVLVDGFYGKVQADPLLGPVFTGAGVEWDHHLPVMYQFWETLLFKTGGYAGRPYPKHAVLPIQGEHFDRWLALFRQAMDEHFEGTKATEAKNWAASIADTFRLRMGLDEPGKRAIL